MSLTTDPNDSGLGRIRPDGQQEVYRVLSDEERAKGFVRPVRRSYKHVALPGPKHPLRDLTTEEVARYKHVDCSKFEAYPADGSGSALVGRFWTQEELDRAHWGCGAVTTMGQAIAETYARDPAFYSGTFCVRCGKHFPLRNADGSAAFLWDDDGSPVGS